jgi:uncharacterized protein YbjT (DUF2867 family)
MKVFIVGIAGQTGFRLAQVLRAHGDEVDGLYRRPEQAEQLAAIGVEATRGDLAQIDVALLADHVRGADAIVFAAGAGDTDSEAMIDAIDGDGVVKTIAAAKLATVQRMLLVSVFPEAGRHEGFGESFEHYIRVKKRADVALAEADLDWVILRPAVLTNRSGTGRISLGPAQIRTKISRDDVAATIAELLQTPAIKRRILELTAGETPITKAVEMQTKV